MQQLEMAVKNTETSLQATKQQHSQQVYMLEQLQIYRQEITQHLATTQQFAHSCETAQARLEKDASDVSNALNGAGIDLSQKLQLVLNAASNMKLNCTLTTIHTKYCFTDLLGAVKKRIKAFSCLERVIHAKAHELFEGCQKSKVTVARRTSALKTATAMAMSDAKASEGELRKAIEMLAAEMAEIQAQCSSFLSQTETVKSDILTAVAQCANVDAQLAALHQKQARLCMSYEDSSAQTAAANLKSESLVQAQQNETCKSDSILAESAKIQDDHHRMKTKLADQAQSLEELQQKQLTAAEESDTKSSEVSDLSLQVQQLKSNKVQIEAVLAQRREDEVNANSASSSAIDKLQVLQAELLAASRTSSKTDRPPSVHSGLSTATQNLQVACKALESCSGDMESSLRSTIARTQQSSNVTRISSDCKNLRKAILSLSTVRLHLLRAARTVH